MIFWEGTGLSLTFDIRMPTGQMMLLLNKSADRHKTAYGHFYCDLKFILSYIT